MATVDPSQVPALVSRMAYTLFEQAKDGYEPLYPRLGRVIALDGIALPDDPSVAFGESFRTVVGAAEPEEIEVGQDSPGRTMTEGYTGYVKFRKLSESMVIPEEMWASPNAEQLIMRKVMREGGDWFHGFMSKKERLFFNLFNKGGYTAGHAATFDGSFPGHVDNNPAFIYDGKPFFALSGNGHPLYLATSTVKHNALAVALSSTNLGTARVLIKKTNAVNEAGEFVGGNEPDTLLVPTALEDSALAIVNSIQQAGSAQNDTNVHRGRFGVIASEYLDDTDAWFVGRARRGIRVYDSGDPVVKVSAPDPRNGNITVRVLAYFGTVVEDWRPWVASQLATS